MSQAVTCKPVPVTPTKSKEKPKKAKAKATGRGGLALRPSVNVPETSNDKREKEKPKGDHSSKVCFLSLTCHDRCFDFRLENISGFTFVGQYANEQRVYWCA